MVTILPPKTNAGDYIGEKLGQGLGKGFAQGGQIGFQRNLVKKTLGELRNLPQSANAFDLASKLIEATAGIPGAERYVGQLFPLLLSQLQSQSLPEGEATARNGLPEQEGYLSAAPLTQGQSIAFAKNLSKQGIPFPQGLEAANQLSAGSEKALAHIQQNLQAQGITKAEMPYAIQMAQLNKNNDPNQVIKDVRKGVDDFRQLDNIITPGPFRAGVKTLGGLIPALLAGGESRDKILKRLNPITDRLIEKGYDPIIREKYAKLGLSPTEIQEQIHRPSPEYLSKINALPAPSKNFQANEERLTDFFLNNLKDQSLLVTKHKLWKDKGYNWQQINDAFRNAMERGLKISNEQDKELSEFVNPPKESILDIFRDWGRPFDVLQERK